MDDSLVAEFTSITSATPAQAEQYLRVTDYNLEHAIQLFFEDPNLATEPAQPPPTAAPRPSRREDSDGVIHIDSDDDDVAITGTRSTGAVDTSDDAEIARRMQEELYATATNANPDDARAPMLRTRETLVGGDDDNDGDDIDSMVHQQMRERLRRRQDRARPGIFNQRDTQAAVWQDGTADPEARARTLSYATGGASERSSKANALAEMYRPPFEIISRLPFSEAREEGKAEEKWIMVNVQDPSVFDCQVLNRDLWKNEDVQSAIKAHFVFLQYDKESWQGIEYIQLYLAARLEGERAYPHIGIIDPRTGELLKSLAASPVPKPADFLMLVYEFLDRYSLRADARNPVARRKPPTQPDVARLSEDDMLRIAMQNSLAATSGVPGGDDAPPDPDELTRSQRAGNGELSPPPASSSPRSSVAPPSAWARIAADRPHIEPEVASGVATTRIQFRWSGGRQVRRFGVDEHVRRVYEWLKSAPPDPTWSPKAEVELIFLGRNLSEDLDKTIGEAGLMNGTVMVELRE